MANRPITDFAQNILKPYINNQDKAYAANIAPVETSPATSAHTAGTQIIYNGVLYDVTADIAANDALATTGAGANIAAADDVSEQISNVKQALSNEVVTRSVVSSHNWLDLDGSEFASINSTVATRTDNGVRVSKSEAGTYLGVSYTFYNLNKNTDYKLSTDITVTAGKGWIRIYADDSTWLFESADLSTGKYEKTFNTGNYTKFRLYLYCAHTTSAAGNVLFDNLMITLATDSDTTYRPYVPTNSQLLSYKDNGVLGAKNFWNNAGYISISDMSVANNGFTNTATDSRTKFYFRLWALDGSGSNIGSNPLYGEEIGSTGAKSFIVTIPSGTKRLRIIHNGASVVLSIIVPFIGEVGTYKLMFDVNGYNPSTAGGLDIRNIMLTLPSDTDPTFQPYAMTNKELTDKTSLLDLLYYPTTVISSVDLNDIKTTGVYRLGGSITNSASGNSGALLVLANKDKTSVRQVQFLEADNNIATRVLYNATWTSWQKVTLTSM